MLKVRDLSLVFNPGTPDEVRALNGVSFSVPPGSFVAIIGTNGSGKSTLLSTIAGTHLSDRGSVHLAGQDITRWPEHKRARLLGRVFQDPFKGTAPHLTVLENLALATRRGQAKGLGWIGNRRQVHDLRDRVRSLNMGLEDRLDAEIGSLSGGQRQALTLLMATWVKPSLLLLDEHTAALDPRSAEQVVRLTRDIIAGENLTALMVTHAMSHAAALGDRLLMMHRGEIIRDISGSEKRHLRPADLLAYFEDVRRVDQLDQGAADMLRAAYV